MHEGAIASTDSCSGENHSFLLFCLIKGTQGLAESGQDVTRVQFECAHEAFRGSDVHVIVLLVRLALQRRLLAGCLLHLQRRLAQGVLFDCGCRLGRQDDVLCESRQQGSLLSVGLDRLLVQRAA